MYNIIIVDDNIYAVDAIKTRADWDMLNVDNAFVAYSMKQAKAIFNDNKIDMMLCDIEMPGGNGLELASWVVRFYPNTIIIFLTCHADFLYAQEALRYGAYDYILKPAPIEKLTRVINEALTTLDKSLFNQKATSEVARQQSAIQQVINYIKQNLEKNLTRESIAKHVYLSPNYLSRLFSKEMGMSLSAYIAAERIEKSKVYLTSTEMPISKIAVKVGIPNTSHFIQIFKRQTGVTPLGYKKER